MVRVYVLSRLGDCFFVRNADAELLYRSLVLGTGKNKEQTLEAAHRVDCILQTHYSITLHFTL